MANRSVSDLDQLLKTDVLKDWMLRKDQSMFSPTTSSSTPPPSSSANNAHHRQQEQRHYNQQQVEPCLSSLENFLFLPQLPVDGERDRSDEEAWTLRRHHYAHKPEKNQQQNSFQNYQQQHPPQFLPSSLMAASAVDRNTKSSSRITTLKNSSSNSFALAGRHQNDDGGHYSSCNKQCYANTPSSILPFFSKKYKNDSQKCGCNYTCGSFKPKPTNSLFPFIAANDTVIVAASSNNFNNDQRATSSAASNNNVVVVNNASQLQQPSERILIKKTSSGCSNGSHNNSAIPFHLAANQSDQLREDNKHSPEFHPPHSNYRQLVRRRCYIFRIFQAFSILLGAFFLLHFLVNSLRTSSEYKYKSLVDSLTSSPPHFPSKLRLVQTWNMPSIISTSTLLSSESSSPIFEAPEILSVSSFNPNENDEIMLFDDFLINNTTKCRIPRDNNSGGGSNDDGTTRSYNNHTQEADTIFFLVLIHSAPDHIQRRAAIRQSWGSVKCLGKYNMKMRLIFLLGREMHSNDYNEKDNHGLGDGKDDRIGESRSSSIHSEIQHESQEHGDIVMGNHIDSYRNLTLKHLTGYRWVLQYCAHAKYILKADDDTFIDIFQLYDFLERTFKDSEPALICNVIPNGTKPVRESDGNEAGKKYAVTYEEYPYDYYPKYCSGLAYIATPSVIREIYRMSQTTKNKPLWIDDVYVLGILRELANVEPFYLNLRYSFSSEYRKWLSSDAKKSYEEDKVKNEISRQDAHSDKEEKDDGKIQPEWTEGHDLSNQVSNEPRLAPPQKIPFMIVHMETATKGLQLGEMNDLWSKTMAVWGLDQSHQLK